MTKNTKILKKISKYTIIHYKHAKNNIALHFHAVLPKNSAIGTTFECITKHSMFKAKKHTRDLYLYINFIGNVGHIMNLVRISWSKSGNKPFLLVKTLYKVLTYFS